ncbi:ArsA family ATPase [Halanaeroarchaeum sulfurireducens]|uniref:Transport ATPase (Substrate arsenite) n=1 Tax=Halanaeroarchaeum sulfurireducens TaxID=1604004 RepID=A0A0F7PAE9_9EURY|nr:ArsA family ATPase [Halanaeroarchaeum sulfurireducens]AKH96629.1 transport ATPase (substrate arsenite) [Halanaeroarchaeum sulfurireducens]ALG81031.1 transport ATPase (substrate arsenite) [Halanaeroarchaeum sulfurireducens]
MNKFVFFGGKGGVGKTTVSSAYGLKCARDGLRTLLVSTDPAHSTSDVFDQAFDDDPSPVDGVENLFAMEIDPDEAVDEHLMEIKRRMTDQVSASIVNALDQQIELAHRTPGAYEAALFDRFIEVMREADDFDRVVFDTSPTGGTLRLLSLPAFLEDWIDRLIEKRAKSIELFEKAAIGEKEARKKAETDDIINHLRERKEKFDFAGDKLRNDSGFYLVLNPDELSIRETERAIEELEDYEIDVDGLVINKITPAPDEGESGVGAQYLRERVATERDRIERIESDFDEPVVAHIEARVEEIKDTLLDDVAAELAIETEANAIA